jgi:dienelactone hydrolase
MQKVYGLLAGLLLAGSAQAAIQSQVIEYKIDGESYTGYLAYDDAVTGERPGVLVVHEWWGHTDYVRSRADKLAELGYTALALDMYGTGKVADHPDDALKFMKVVSENQQLAEKRFNAAYVLLQADNHVDADRIAAIGYCFGGSTVLNVARQNSVDLAGVVSFHGGLATQVPAEKGRLVTPILVLNGAADPMVPPEQVAGFEKEMKNAGADYRLVSYEGVVHGFTNPGATLLGERFNMPLAYDEVADKNSWEQMQVFLERVFGQ